MNILERVLLGGKGFFYVFRWKNDVFLCSLLMTFEYRITTLSQWEGRQNIGRQKKKINTVKHTCVLYQRIRHGSCGTLLSKVFSHIELNIEGCVICIRKKDAQITGDQNYILTLSGNFSILLD